MSAEPKPSEKPLWAITLLVAVTFVLTGIGKLASMPPSPENFARWGLSMQMMYAIGALEVLGGLGLLLPRTATLAALGLAATMVGAVRTGVVFHETMHIVLPAVLIVLLLVIAYARRERLVRRG